MESTENRRGQHYLKLRVSFPDGKVLCYSNVIDTFMETLAKIGPEELQKVNLTIGGLPLITNTIFPKFKNYLKPFCEGWYVNTQSDTDGKYRQLRAIVMQLNLDIQVEIGENFITTTKKKELKEKKAKNKLLVKLPNGKFIGGENPIDTYIETLWELGIEEIYKKHIVFAEREIITNSQKYNGQIQIGKDRWTYIPNQTKDKYRALMVIGAFLHIQLQITII